MEKISRCNMYTFHAMECSFFMIAFSVTISEIFFSPFERDAFNASQIYNVFFLSIKPTDFVRSCKYKLGLTDQFLCLFPNVILQRIFLAPFDCSSKRHTEFKTNKLHFNTSQTGFFLICVADVERRPYFYHFS